MKTIIFVLMLFLTLAVTGQPKLDLYKLTLNGSILNGLTVEKLTDLLGRPSAVETNEIMSDMAGPLIYYYNKGMTFLFNAKKDDSQQRIFIINIYMNKNLDRVHGKFLPFSGVVSPQVNCNMKIKDILPLFKNYKVSLKTGEENSSERGFGFAEMLDRPDIVQKDDIKIDVIGNEVHLYCEELTKYLDLISIKFKY